MKFYACACENKNEHACILCIRLPKVLSSHYSLV